MAFYIPPREAGPKTHLPVCIVIDKSESTEDIRDLLNQGAQSLIRSMKEELTFRGIVELLVVQFSSETEITVDFKPLEQIGEHDLDIGRSEGFTATGRALLTALDRLDQRKMEWKRQGEEYFQPLLFLLTDGYPDAGIGAPDEVVQDIKETYEIAAREIRDREDGKKLVFIAAGLQQQNGYQANMEELRRLSAFPDRVLQISDFEGNSQKIKEFYQLIHRATDALLTDTPIQDVLSQFWDTGKVPPTRR